MRTEALHFSLALCLSIVTFAPLSAADADAPDPGEAARIARIEQRLAELEGGLASDASATTAPVAADGGESGLLWTQPQQWEGVQLGISRQQVLELLGDPTSSKQPLQLRNLKSAESRIDLIYYYQPAAGDSLRRVSGKVSFRDGIVVALQRPDF